MIPPALPTDLKVQRAACPPKPWRRPVPRALSIAASLILAAAATRAADTPPIGFSTASGAAERALEQRFDQQLSAADLRSWMQTMSSAPNQVGSPHDRANAEFMAQQLRSFGWEVHLETYYVLYPTPLEERLELLGEHPYTATLHEPPVPGDASSANPDGGLPPYNAYGADGDVTGGLVYVNYGMPADYEELARRNVSVRGRIVLARYGAGWRGLKPKLAYEHGAVGCLIYSDPGDDGYRAGDAYPAGGWRTADGVQRGSVADMTLYSGDPLTPGWASTQDAKRLPIDQAKTILHIPVLPISYADAQPFLAVLGGQVAPPSWCGGLPLTYHIGPSSAQVHLKVRSDWKQRPIYDVIALLRGSQYPDDWVIRGNHHDGWVFGAWDPLSGNVALMEEAKAIGALARGGWRPKRTLVYTGWDGEEPGLLGSTEWVEDHQSELQKKAVLYVNSDTNARGFLAASGSHGLQRLVNEVAADVRDPETQVSVRQRALAREGVANFEKGDAARLPESIVLDALGSGSDFTPFLQHAGIASLVLEYTGEDDDAGIYHSTYDSFDHYVRFGDPTFAYGIALAQTIGRTVLRTADADILPYHFADFAARIAAYVDELHHLETSMRDRDAALRRLVEAGAFRLAADPTRPVAAPAEKGPVPYVNLSPLDNAVVELKREAERFDRAEAKALAEGRTLDSRRAAAVDGLLRGIEQTLLDPVGLPGRAWYRHLVYAPGQHTGYAVKTLPGVRESIELRQWALADEFSVRTAQALRAYARRVGEAAHALQ